MQKMLTFFLRPFMGQCEFHPVPEIQLTRVAGKIGFIGAVETVGTAA